MSNEETTGGGLLPAALVPQANRLARVAAFVCGQELAAHLHGRDRAYYAQAARVLGFVQDSGEVTARGLSLRAASAAERRSVLRKAFEDCTVGERWRRFAAASSLATVDPQTAERFLRAESALGERTAIRRADTLRRWWHAVYDGPAHPTVPPAVPTADAIVGLPVDAQGLVSGFLREPLQRMDVLCAHMASHVRAFERAARTNEFVDVDEAQAIFAALSTLGERVAAGPASAQHVWQAAVRYFLLTEDADSDFDVGGLMDDVEVVNAVARHLGHGDVCVGGDEG